MNGDIPPEVGILKVTMMGPVDDGDDWVKRLEVLYEAHNAFALAPMMGKSSNLDSERLYYTLYQDILQHQDVWFGGIFMDEESIHHAEQCCGILGTLATIRRQRGDVACCLEIFDTCYTRVLQAYQRLVDSEAGTAGDRTCCRALMDKSHLIATNAHSQTGNKQAAVQHFRALVKYEIEENYELDRQAYAFLIRKFVHSGHCMSKAKLAKVSDDQIWSVLSMVTPPPPSLCSFVMDAVTKKRCTGTFCAAVPVPIPPTRRVTVPKTVSVRTGNSSTSASAAEKTTVPPPLAK